MSFINVLLNQNIKLLFEDTVKCVNSYSIDCRCADHPQLRSKRNAQP